MNSPESVFDVNTLLAGVRAQMDKAVAVTREDLATIRTGRATPALVESISISAYEGTQQLKVRELATITAADATTLTIAPFDPSVAEDIAKGIAESNSGLTPSVDGDMVRIHIPPLSQQQREEYARFARTKLEGGKVLIRQVRHDAMQQVRQATDAKEISDDTRHRLEKQIQDITDDHNQQLDEMGKRKETELLQI